MAWQFSVLEVIGASSLMRRLIKLLRLLGRNKYRAGLIHGVAAAIEHVSFLRSVPMGTLIDAGANKGQFSLVARGERGDVRIIAFEPLKRPHRIYSSLFAGDKSVTVVNAALGAEAGEADIHVSRSDDSSSLLPIGRLQCQIFPGTEEVGKEHIRVMRLDEAVDAVGLAHPLVLKMDVQGFELEVLKGAEKSLPYIDGIYVELSFVPLYEGQPVAHEVIKWLDERGFFLAGVYHVAYGAQGIAIQADMYFRRDQISG
jgi:FkbM family methyltransferase